MRVLCGRAERLARCLDAKERLRMRGSSRPTRSRAAQSKELCTCTVGLRVTRYMYLTWGYGDIERPHDNTLRASPRLGGFFGGSLLLLGVFV